MWVSLVSRLYNVKTNRQRLWICQMIIGSQMLDPRLTLSDFGLWHGKSMVFLDVQPDRRRRRYFGYAAPSAPTRPVPGVPTERASVCWRLTPACVSLSRTRGGKRWARASSTASPCPASPPRSPSTTATGTACCRPTSSRWGDPGATYGPRESGLRGEGRRAASD